MTTVVDKGIEIISKLINGVASTAFTYMANGSGDNVEATDRTALETENTLYGSERVAATCTNESDTTAVWNKVFTASGGSVTIREVGIFDAASAGNMVLIHVYASNKTIDDGESIDITLKINVAGE